MNRFEFDRKFLEDTVSMLKAKLGDESLSIIDKCNVDNDLYFFQNMLKGNFVNTCDEEDFDEDVFDDDLDDDYTIDDCVEMFISKCRELYDILGIRAINLIIKLYEKNIFYYPKFQEKVVLPIEEQAEYTIKNYERNSRKLLVPASSILFPKDHPHIQCVDSFDESSFCYYSEVLREPFIIVDPENGESILNHEVEHACESIIGIGKKIDFQEVGSIFHELLFCDLLREKVGDKYSTAIPDRIVESTCFIRRLYPLFLIIKELQKRHFEVSSDELFELCSKYDLLDEETTFYEYVVDNVMRGGIDTMVNYLFSHLKAIELREKAIRTGRDSLDLLVEEMSRPLTYRSSDDKILIYKRFLDENK